MAHKDTELVVVKSKTFELETNGKKIDRVVYIEDRSAGGTKAGNGGYFLILMIIAVVIIYSVIQYPLY